MFSMAIGPLNVDLSGQFRKLLLDRCDADVAAAAFAAIAANGTEAEVLIEDGICLTNVSLRSFLWWTHSTGHKHLPHQGVGSQHFKKYDAPKVSLVWQM